MITYEYIGNFVVVFLDGKNVGRIDRVIGGYKYFPLCDKQGGETFGSLQAVKNSLEDEVESC